MSEEIFLSVVIPVFNEADNVGQLHDEVLKVCKSLKKSFEIIFVNDGSTDDTFKNLKKLKPIKIINLRTNFGQTSAMDAGIKESKGELIVTLDGDLQNDPQDIPKLIKKLEDGFDVVSGWRKERNDPFMKKFLSKGAHELRKILVHDGIHDSGCTLKVYRRECFDSVDLYGEMHRFIPAILRWKGFKIGEIVVNHRARKSGESKYGTMRLLKGFLDLVNVWFWRKFLSRPLHLFGGIGFLLSFLGGILGMFALYKKFFQGVDLSDTALTLLSAFLFMTGILLFVLGLMADVLSRLYFSRPKNEVYMVKDIKVNE